MKHPHLQGPVATVVAALVVAACAQDPPSVEPTSAESVSSSPSARVGVDVEVVSVQIGAATGVGVVISDDGYVLTTNLAGNGVIGSAATVTSADGEAVDASVIGLDSHAWLAVVGMHEIPAIEPVVFAESLELSRGDRGRLVGAAASLARSVPVLVTDTSTVVGSVGTVDFSALEPLAEPSTAGGGVVVSDAGEVLGLVVASTSNGRDHSAIAATVLSRVAQEMISSGSSSHPFLGASVAASAGRGVLVETVTPDSPAEAAGLLPGDLIVRFDGTKTRDPADLIAAIQASSVGDIVILDCERGDLALPMTVTLSDLPSPSDHF